MFWKEMSYWKYNYANDIFRINELELEEQNEDDFEWVDEYLNQEGDE